MSSAKAMKLTMGSCKASAQKVRVRVPYRGALEITVQAILGGVRSACSYVRARRIKDLPKCTTFIRVTQTTNEVYQNSMLRNNQYFIDSCGQKPHPKLLTASDVDEILVIAAIGAFFAAALTVPAGLGFRLCLLHSPCY